VCSKAWTHRRLRHRPVRASARRAPSWPRASRSAISSRPRRRICRRGQGQHLSYVGDADVGAAANLGAGTITCNYDGANKHRTVIGAGAFIGSNSSLVAPVEIGEEATVGAGSVISGEAPAGQLTISRARQRTIAGWKRPRKRD
jgi:bifunctional UDP-N-acetylglucosamine pyrophosphorylase / glucosamine-1-phosphate N-acetyltransferase